MLSPELLQETYRIHDSTTTYQVHLLSDFPLNCRYLSGNCLLDSIILSTSKEPDLHEGS